MKSTEAAKRSYHPLVISFCHSGILDKKFQAQIPATTRHFWKTHDPATLYGFDWVQDLPNNMSESTRHIFKSEFLQHRLLRDQQDLLVELDRFQEYYNWNRFPEELLG